MREKERERERERVTSHRPRCHRRRLQSERALDAASEVATPTISGPPCEMARVPEPPRAVYPTVASMTAARLLLSWAGFRRRTKYESKKRDTLLPLLSSVLSAAGHSHSFARSLARYTAPLFWPPTQIATTTTTTTTTTMFLLFFSRPPSSVCVRVRVRVRRRPSQSPA